MLSYFTVGDTLIEQFRGSPMGSLCRPALCNLVVAVEEQCWRHTYNHLFSNHKYSHHRTHREHALYFATRYVDNRVLLLPKHLLALPPFQQLADALFYKPPVQLETEPANIFLGFAIDPQRRSLTPQCNVHRADILHPWSVATKQTLRSSYQARIRLIQRVTAPHQRAHVAIRAMRDIYADAGYTDTQLCG